MSTASSVRNGIAGFLAVILLLSACQEFTDAFESGETEILWDEWGVPHIYAETNEELFYAFGWSQMHSHGDLILQLYGQARGESARLWGDQPMEVQGYPASSYSESDRLVRTLGIPDRAERWMEEQPPDQRRYLDAFVQGMNAYAEKHPEKLDSERQRALPLEAADVFAHVQRTVHITFLTGQALGSAEQWQQGQLGSNAYAIGPEKSSSGNSLLLANPHLPWHDLFTFYEAHLNAPDLNIYGATLVGLPSIVIGFNEHLGWTHTVNPHDGADLYELTLMDGGESYRWDGGTQSLDVRSDTLFIRQDDGSEEAEPFEIRGSTHGPVIAQHEDQALALRLAGWDTSGLLSQYWEMMTADSHQAFESALSRLQLPLFNVLYADKDGNIQYVFNAQVPERPHGDWSEWKAPVRGDTSSTLWHATLPYEDLPQVINPSSGWVHNANDGPWTATDSLSYQHTDFPSYLARPGMSPTNSIMRPQRSVRMMQERESVSFDDLRDIKMDTRVELADRIVDDLVAAAQAHGNSMGQRAADVLANWDRNVDSGSQGAVLFFLWRQHAGSNVFEEEWDPDDPFDTPRGLRSPEAASEALEQAATELEGRGGSLDVAWGDIFRLNDGQESYPAHGGPDPLGVYMSLWFAEDGDGTQRAAGGDSFISLVEFGDTVRAEALLTYGNATQSHTSYESQLALFADKQLREVRFYREQVEAFVERRDTIDTSAIDR